MPRQDDSYLIEEILGGNNQAFVDLMDKYEQKVFNFSLYLLRNREEAEEATQDTFVKAHRALSTFRNEAKFTTWLLKIAYFNCLTRLRKSKQSILSIEANGSFLGENGVDSTGKITQQSDIRLMLKMVMKQLSNDERTMVTLFYYNEQTIKEICEITNMTVSNVKVILHRSRTKMLKVFNQLGIKEWV